MLKQNYFLTDFFILSAEKQPIKLSWRNIVWLLKYAYEQGCKLAFFFLDMIGRLYKLEKEYRRLQLSPQEIYERRNDDATTEIVESIRTRLYEPLVDGNEVNSNLC